MVPRDLPPAMAKRRKNMTSFFQVMRQIAQESSPSPSLLHWPSRVSSRPTSLSAYRAKDKQLPRPIPKPFATLTGSSITRTSFSPVTGNTGGSGIPPPPPLLQSSDSSSCSPPPPPLLYIPAAAQRVTHLHGPPTLQRFPSTSPTRDQESNACPDQQQHQLSINQDEGPPPLQRFNQDEDSINQDEGPPPLQRFPPVVIEHEGAKKNNELTEPFLTQGSASEFQTRSLWSPTDKNESKPIAVNTANNGRSSTSLCDLTKISEVDAEGNRTASPWRSKEMPLLRRHSSAGEFTDVCVEEPAHFSGCHVR
ncbi:hypothetical protein OS493_004881 [Desmophyllum pertusum]|uniref:Uncharacterized protein n=1 Tax=Desmophyllum pertusum TaxID=174260 RepID=A0A9W9Z680_9CNID|nr:hypothetical protein OS493_004881 [Desmophyllum pertusum]